jgi:hypothetical protein
MRTFNVSRHEDNITKSQLASLAHKEACHTWLDMLAVSNKGSDSGGSYP